MYYGIIILTILILRDYNALTLFHFRDENNLLRRHLPTPFPDHVTRFILIGSQTQLDISADAKLVRNLFVVVFSFDIF